MKSKITFYIDIIFGTIRYFLFAPIHLPLGLIWMSIEISKSIGKLEKLQLRIQHFIDKLIGW